MNAAKRSARSEAEGYYFTRKMFWRQYFPALISALTLTASDVADSVVVGNSLGTVGLAAMGFSLPIFMVYNVIMHSFGLGGSIRFAGQMSRGEDEKAAAGFQGVFFCLAILGAAIAALGNLLIYPVVRGLGADPQSAELFAATKTYVRLLLASAPLFFFSYSLGYYMRNADMEKEASLCASVGNICDVALNIVLVLICRMGVLGAGIATMAGVLISSGMELVFISLRKSPLRLLPMRPDFSGLFQTFRMGFSSSVSYVYALAHILLCNNLLMRISGELGVAVFDLIQNVGYFFAYLYGAASRAMQPILSTYQEEYNHDGCRTLLKLGLRVALCTDAAAALILALAAPQVCRFFGMTDAEAVALGAWAIRMFCVSTIFGGVSELLSSYCQSRGAELPTFLSTSLRGLLVLIPVTILFSLFGEQLFWLLYPATAIVALAAFLIYLRFGYHEKADIAPARVYRAMLHSDTAEIGPVIADIEAFCEKWEADTKQRYFVQMTVEELCSAIIVNGFLGKDTRGMIQITLVAGEDGIFTLHVRDSAVAFNPFAMKNGELAADSEGLDFNALGMNVIKQRSREFFYRRYQGFNTMVVKI